MHIAKLMDNLSKMSRRNDDKSAVTMWKITRQLGCVFQDKEPPKSASTWRKSSKIQKPIQRVKCTKAVLLHADIRDQNPSLGSICPRDPRQRNPDAPKFEDRSQEETEWQERCFCESAWRLVKSVLNRKRRKTKAVFFSPLENRCLLACLHHQLSNLRNENLLWTPGRRYTWSGRRTWTEFCWIGNFDEIVKPYDSQNRQWRSANAW